MVIFYEQYNHIRGVKKYKIPLENTSIQISPDRQLQILIRKYYLPNKSLDSCLDLLLAGVRRILNLLNEGSEQGVQHLSWTLHNQTVGELIKQGCAWLTGKEGLILVHGWAWGKGFPLFHFKIYCEVNCKEICISESFNTRILTAK